MSELVLRNLPQDILARLRSLAGAHGITLEEEGVRLLKKAVESDEASGSSFVTHLLSNEGRVDDIPLPPKTYSVSNKIEIE